MLTPHERDVLLENPDVFIRKYFSHKIMRLEDFHLRLIDTVTKNNRSLILYPAAHGKTTLISTLLPIWALCKDPNIRMVIVAKNDMEAKGIMQVIHAELMGNTELIRDFGPFYPADDDTKPWALERLSVHKRTKIDKSPTIMVMGSGSSTILGHRSDWVICDDVVTEKNSATPEARHKLREWFNLKVETSPEHDDSRLTVIGTLFDPDDLYNDLWEMVYPDTGQPIYARQREDAIADEENEVTLWPARWSWKRLMGQKAKMGTLDFNKRYRNIAVDKSRMVFLEEYIRGGYVGPDKKPGCLDKTHRIGDYEEDWRRYAGFDPAVGVSRSRKFCAHVTLALGSCKDHERCFWVIDLERQQLTLPQQVEMILKKHQEYDLFKSMVEANSYQAGLHQAIQQKMDESGVTFSVDPHYTTRTNKPDPELGVQAMARYFENGQVHIPWGDPYSQTKMRQLVDELVQFPGRTTDTVMAFWMAWRAAQESAPKFTSYSRLKKEAPLWSRQTKRRVVKNPYYA